MLGVGARYATAFLEKLIVGEDGKIWGRTFI